MNTFFTPPRRHEDQFRGMITGAIVISCILIFLILFAWMYTITRTRVDRLKSAMVMNQSQAVQSTDTMFAAPPATSSAPYSAPGVHSRLDIDYLSNSSSYKYASLRTGNNLNSVASGALDDLQSRTNELCRKIRALSTNFSDTIYAINADAAATQSFFVATGRAEELRQSMQYYEGEVSGRISMLGSSVADLSNYLPVDDYPGARKRWDSSKFSGEPYEVQSYLLDLEYDVRSFENTALDKIH